MLTVEAIFWFDLLENGPHLAHVASVPSSLSLFSLYFMLMICLFQPEFREMHMVYWLPLICLVNIRFIVGETVCHCIPLCIELLPKCL